MELYEAVNDLTLPKTVKVLQGADIPVVLVPWVVSVQVPPLLDQLDEAIRSDMGLTQSGASLAHERNILDADALQKFIQISSQIRDWCRMAGVRKPSRQPARALQQWHVAAMGSLNEASEVWHTETLQRWASYVRGKLDPPRERELPGACPVCGECEWWRDGVRFVRPLVVRYRVGPGLLVGASGHCRACARVWGVRELSYLIEQKAKEGTP
jgi:hypothetical protein